jgi:hypothetical protein
VSPVVEGAGSDRLALTGFFVVPEAVGDILKLYASA